jgi:transcriptional regulator with XRE-family HTH domain
MAILLLKQVLKEKHISMGKLSRMSDVSFSTISRICNDPLYSPTLSTLETIAKALDMSVRDLIEDEENDKKE